MCCRFQDWQGGSGFGHLLSQGLAHLRGACQPQRSEQRWMLGRPQSADLEGHREDPPRRKLSGKRSPPQEGGGLQAGSEVVEGGLPNSANAREEHGLDGGCGPSVMRAVQLAAGELSQEEMASLQDPGFRSQAARWRSGSGSRKISAAFARLLNALYSIKPGWAASTGPSVCEPLPTVEALPINRIEGKNDQTWSQLKGMVRMAYVFLVKYWRTLWVLLVVIMFPKLASAMVAMVIRMVIRFIAAMVMRVFRELTLELGGVLAQLSTLTTGVEQTLVHQLDMWMIDWSPSPGIQLGGDSSTSDSATVAAPPGANPIGGHGAQPSPPSGQLFTQALLVFNLILHWRTHR